jgi:hypothetical protein
MIRQRVFSIVADIPDDKHECALRKLLDGLPRTILAPLEMLHFGCFVIFDKERLDDLPEKNGTMSKLVFECNIDGSVATFLDALMELPIIEDIYCHCHGYPAAAAKDVKRDFLHDNIRWPQLYHIGAPNRSTRSINQDRELRRALDDRLAEVMTSDLNEQLSKRVIGDRQYWAWDVFRPWFAWMLGLAGPSLALWLVFLTRRLPFGRVVITLLMAACALLTTASVVAAYRIWITTRPELRDRVRPWIKWAVAGVLWFALVAVAWARDRRRAVGLAIVFVLITVFNVYAAVQRRANERLVTIRENSTRRSILSVWDALSRLASHTDERPPWWQWLWNARTWVLAYLVVLGLVWLSSRRASVLVTALTVLFFLKSVWLSILLGWPAPDRGDQDSKRIVAFIIVVSAVAAAGFAILTAVHTPVVLLALIVLVTLFSLWAVPLPSPSVTFKSLSREEKANLLDQEDLDVQNHMSALVVIRQDRFYRLFVLKSFLCLLNHLFFRSWLPDLYRGKLFGIPTVQFCQWLVLDKRNYLFLSNYDNSWSPYLDDFGRRLVTGIQKIWGQGRGNPGTKDLGRFKDFARTTMVKHSLWYSAYEGLTLRQVWNNEHIRRELVRGAGEEEMVSALRRLGAAPKTLSDFLHAKVN